MERWSGGSVAAESGGGQNPSVVAATAEQRRQGRAASCGSVTAEQSDGKALPPSEVADQSGERRKPSGGNLAASGGRGKLSRDCIMFPELPLALRLSGHLLLGLVRIYSWKVNYLLQECNRMKVDIRTAFHSENIDLPEGADRAPFEFVTLPDTFQLDALELDDTRSQLDGPDKYLKSFDQITLQDQVSADGDPYVAFYITEDNLVGPSPQPMTSNTGAGAMEIDVMAPFEGDFDALATLVDAAMTAGEFSQSNQADASTQVFNEGQLSEELPEIEVMRDAVHDFGSANHPKLGDTINDMNGMHEHSGPTTKRKRSLSPILEGMSVSGQGESLSLPVHANAPTVASHDDLDILNTGTSFGNPLPQLELQPSPPNKKQKEKPRKRKCFFDEFIVLRNAEMKKQLVDTTELVFKRRKLPCSALYVWRFQKTLKNERILHEPVIPGMCTNLQGVFDKSYPRSRIDSAPLEASPSPTPTTATVPAPAPAPPNASSDHVMPDTDMELEQPRFGSHVEGNMPDLMPSPSLRVTPFYASTLGSSADIRKTFDREVLLTLEEPISAERVRPEPETPLFYSEDQQHLHDSAFQEIPRLQNSADAEELDFLETSIASTGIGAFEVGNLSARTRAVAQYFKDHSPTTEILENQSGNLSLQKILAGKTRKQCARMFFETTVLTSYDFINVQQEAAYDDILITPTPALATVKF